MQLQNNSKRKHKQSWFKYIIMLLLIITVSCLNKPITVYADSTNVTSLNGEAEHGYGSQVGKLHWAGSTSRTGFIFYFTDESGKLLSLLELGVANVNTPIAIQVINPDYQADINKHTDKKYAIKASWNGCDFFPDSTVIKITDSSAPSAVQFDESTGRWSGNGQEVANWLFKESFNNDRQKWEDIVIYGFNQYPLTHGKGYELIDKIKMQEKFNLVIMPISVNAIYGTETWGDEAATFSLNRSDLDFLEYIHPDNVKPAVQGKIIRYCTSAHYMSQYVYEKTGCATGGANWKWTNEALPFSMTFQENQLDKTAIPQSTRPSRLDYNTINSYGMSYGMGALTKEVKLSVINTYDIDRNPTRPAEGEEPREDRETTGNNTIIKLYYDKITNSETNETTVRYVGTYKREGTIHNIMVEDEESKSGYKIDCYGGFTRPLDVPVTNYADVEYAIVYLSSHKGWDPGLVEMEESIPRIFYVVYIKEENETDEGDPEPYDFVLSESYVSKQIYFSEGKHTSTDGSTPEANDLPITKFRYT